MGNKLSYDELERKVQELRDSEGKYRNILENIEDSYLEVDLEGNFKMFNQAFCKMLGCKKEGLIGKNNLEFLDKKNAEKIFKIFHDVYITREPAINAAWQFTRVNGTIRDCEASISLIVDEKNEPVGFRGFGRDITDRKKIEAALQHSKEEWEQTFDAVQDLIMIMDNNHRIVRANKPMADRVGMSPEEMVGQTCYNIVHGTDKPVEACPHSLLLKDHKFHSVEVQEERLGGDFVVAVSPIMLSQGGLQGSVHVAHDITKRKKAEEILAQNEKRFRDISMSMADWIWETDTKGRYVFSAGNFKKVLGYETDELMGKTPFDFMPEEEVLKVKPAFMELVIKKQPIVDLKNWNQKKDGTRVCLLTNGVPILNDAGELTGYRGVDKDITKEKEAQDELNQMNQELEKAIENANMMAYKAEIANIAKSEFLANMSHEIRTPLNGVIGMTGLLLDTELTNDQQHYVNTVQNSGESLLSVINDILDFSKIEAGKLEMETINFDLRSLLDDFASMMSMRVQEKDLEFVCAASPDVPALLQGDPGRLRQILANLVGNAVKFTAKGEISVRAYLEKETQKDVTLLFSIKDTGIGIPKEKHELLFQSFTQADASTTREFGGTGLGLTISKTLCEMMGGEIGVNSEVGKGSEFLFTACFKKQAEPAYRAMHAQKVDMKGSHVLIVDDNKTNREILQGQLGSWGCEVKEAVDGSDAIGKFYQADNEKDPFQIAILDMQMPGMDGLSLGKIIKADDKFKSVHLIMMTSMGQAGDAKLFKQVGFAAYLIKPVGYSDLFDCMVTIISGDSRPQVESAIITRHTVREQHRKNIRILLAEDNLTNQQVAIGVLKKFGFVGVQIVENGTLAVKAVLESSYDLVLMDIQMPEMDGHEATRQIRKIESESAKKRIPIIAMTAHAMKEDRDKCIAAGMDEYVSKPIDPTALLEVLERWLPKKKSAAPPVSESKPVLKQKISGQDNLKVFDKEALMERMMDDIELFETILLTFLDDMPRQMEALKNHIDQKKCEDAGKQGHQIKGASANVGADALRDIASKIEMAGKSGDSDELLVLLPQLEEAFDKLKKEMEVII